MFTIIIVHCTLVQVDAPAFKLSCEGTILDLFTTASALSSIELDVTVPLLGGSLVANLIVHNTISNGLPVVWCVAKEQIRSFNALKAKIWERFGAAYANRPALIVYRIDSKHQNMLVSDDYDLNVILDSEGVPVLHITREIAFN